MKIDIEVSLRVAASNDVEAIVFILQQVSHYSTSLSEVIRVINDIAKSSSSECLVAEIDNFVVGTASLFVIEKVRAGVAGYIEDVAVLPEYQKLGIGHLLISKLLEIAEKKGCYKVILEGSESGVSLYERMGFQKGSITMKKFM